MWIWLNWIEFRCLLDGIILAAPDLNAIKLRNSILKYISAVTFTQQKRQSVLIYAGIRNEFELIKWNEPKLRRKTELLWWTAKTCCARIFQCFTCKKSLVGSFRCIVTSVPHIIIRFIICYWSSTFQCGEHKSKYRYKYGYTTFRFFPSLFF